MQAHVMVEAPDAPPTPGITLHLTAQEWADLVTVANMDKFFEVTDLVRTKYKTHSLSSLLRDIAEMAAVKGKARPLAEFSTQAIWKRLKRKPRKACDQCGQCMPHQKDAKHGATR